MARVVSAVIAVGGLAAATFAQDLTHKAGPQEGPIVILGATIHPVSSEPIPDGAIWFVDGKIAGLGTAAEFEDFAARARWSAPLRRIDAKGMHVAPGLIAPYTQLGISEIQAVPATIDIDELGGFSPEAVPASSANPDSTLLPVTRANGVLLAGVFPQGGIVPGRVSVIRMDGWTNDDLTASAVAGVILDWPTMVRGREDNAARAIREDLDRIARIFDLAKAYADARDADPTTTIDARWEAMRVVLPRGTEPPAGRVFILADEYEQIMAAATFAGERGLRAVIVGGRDADLAAAVLKERSIPVIIRGTHVLPRRADMPHDTPFTLPTRLAQAGVAFSIASADDTAHERNLPYNAAIAVAYGLDPAIGLRAVTLDAARCLGVEDRYGSLEEGKSATLIVTTGNPLDVLTMVRHAFIDGREADLTNKHTELAEKYRERYRQSGDLPRTPRPAP